MKPCCHPCQTCWTSGWGCLPSCHHRIGRREPALWTWLQKDLQVFVIRSLAGPSKLQISLLKYPNHHSKASKWSTIEYAKHTIPKATVYGNPPQAVKPVVLFQVPRVELILGAKIDLTPDDFETFSPIFPSELANCSASLLTRSSGLNTQTFSTLVI